MSETPRNTRRSSGRPDPLALAAGLRHERTLSSVQFKDGKFRNTLPVAPGIKGNPWPVMGEYFFSDNHRVPRAPLPVVDPRPAWAKSVDTGLRATWLGHSTVLLEIDGVRVLTDPVFGERASPVSFAGPKRFHPTPVSIAQLPALDAVLLSHDHYDHLCEPSIRELARSSVPFVTSLGVGKHLSALGVSPERIHELDWWEEYALPSCGLLFTAAPAQHFSGRGLGDRNETLWSSFRIRSDRHSVFFSGDTGFTQEFGVIGQRLGPFDLVMLEVGAFHPSWGDIHLGPENALRVHALLGSGALMPVHWGTFNLALHAWDEPAETLVQLASKGSTQLVTPRLGEAVEPLRADPTTPWWRGIEPGR